LNSFLRVKCLTWTIYFIQGLMLWMGQAQAQAAAAQAAVANFPLGACLWPHNSF
jgi:hypothetical protein